MATRNNYPAKIILVKVVFFLLLVSINSSCKKPENAALTAFNNFNRSGMLTNIGNNIIIPSYTAFTQKADSLYWATERFTANPTAGTLDTLQHQWLQANFAWKSCELFDFGPAYNNGNNNNIQMSFLVNSTFIEETINKTPVPYDSTFIPKPNLNLDIRGISALEYLLFDPVNGNTTILSNYTANSAASSQRLNYLLGLAQDIHTNAHSILTAWAPSGGNYIQTFISANGNDQNSSIGFLVNQIVAFADYIKNDKIGDPLGEQNNSLTNPACSTCVETFYSNHAFASITTNYQSINNVFFGIGNNGVKGLGFDSLLNVLNSTVGSELLSKAVQGKMDTINIEINAFNVPLQQAVTSDASQVTTLFNSSKQLLVLLKIDMVNSLGVILTTTDNDGD